MPELAVTTSITSWGAGAAPGDADDVVVLLHGYGSNAADLVALGPALPDRYAWASLQAPIVMGGGGFSWFPITTPGRPDAEPVEAATAAIGAWISAQLPSSARVVVLGFSQGGLMASQLLRSVPRRVEAAVILGGFVLDGVQAGDEGLAAARPPVFDGRGTADGVIPAHAVAHASAWLPEHSTLTARVYAGLGHGIDDRELADVVAFLEGLPAGPP
jgi:phospholipase/carboxylesterase